MALLTERSSEPKSPPSAPLSAYVAAVAITVVAILSPYFLPQLLPAVQPVYSTLLTGLLIVYGLPIVAFTFLLGPGPLRGYFSNPGSAVVEGLRWYGAMSLLGLVVAIAIVAVLTVVDPSAVSQLSKLSPPLIQAEADPWFWVAFSFVVGIVEETIFRGWIFGYWLLRDPSRWAAHAVWTSGLFASAHLYYGKTYGYASGVAFAELFFAGMGFAFAVRYSRGNLLVVGLLHGAHDALSFSTLVWKPYGVEFYYLLILLGVVVFLAVFLQRRPGTQPASMRPWEAGSMPPSTVPFSPGPNPAIVWPPPPESVDRPPLPSPPPPSDSSHPPGP